MLDKQVQTFEIMGELPDLNYIIDACKTHWSNYKTLKQIYSEKVAYCAMIDGVDPIDGQVDIHCHWICPNRLKDKDNITGGGLKMILDGLVDCRILPNDGWKQIGDISHSFAVDKKKPRIEVRLTKNGTKG